MYDTFNPLGIQGEGVHSLHEQYFVTSEVTQWSNFP